MNVEEKSIRRYKWFAFKNEKKKLMKAMKRE